MKLRYWTICSFYSNYFHFVWNIPYYSAVLTRFCIGRNIAGLKRITCIIVSTWQRATQAKSIGKDSSWPLSDTNYVLVELKIPETYFIVALWLRASTCIHFPDIFNLGIYIYIPGKTRPAAVNRIEGKVSSVQPMKTSTKQRACFPPFESIYRALFSTVKVVQADRAASNEIYVVFDKRYGSIFPSIIPSTNRSFSPDTRFMENNCYSFIFWHQKLLYNEKQIAIFVR